MLLRGSCWLKLSHISSSHRACPLVCSGPYLASDLIGRSPLLASWSSGFAVLGKGPHVLLSRHLLLHLAMLHSYLSTWGVWVWNWDAMGIGVLWGLGARGYSLPGPVVLPQP